MLLTLCVSVGVGGGIVVVPTLLLGFRFNGKQAAPISIFSITFTTLVKLVQDFYEY